MSIAVYDDELQRSIEPGTPTTAARLATVTAARAAASAAASELEHVDLGAAAPAMLF